MREQPRICCALGGARQHLCQRTGAGTIPYAFGCSARRIPLERLALSRALASPARMATALRRKPISSEPRPVDEDRALLAAIVESSLDAIVTTTLSGEITSWNKSAERIYGYRAEDVIGRHISLIAPSDRAAEVDASLEKLEQGRRVNQYETVRLRKDGKRIEVSLTVSPVRNSAGTIIGTSGISRDITERNRTERELRDFETQYHEIYENTPMFAAVSTDGIIVDCNRSLIIATGYTKQELIGRHVFDIYHPDTLKRRNEAMRSFVETGNVRGAELQLIRKNGGHVDVYVNMSSVRDERGDILYSRTIARDISEQKRASEALRESEAKYRDLYENAPDMFASITPEGTILDCNQAHATALGHTKDEIIGRHVLDIYHPDSREAAAAALRTFSATGVLQDTQLQLQHRNGRKIDVSLNVSAVRDANGNILYSRAVLRDITARREAEEALRHSEAALRGVVETAPCMLIILRLDDTLAYFSPFAEELTGYSASEVLGRDYFRIFISDETVAQRIHAEMRRISGGTPTRGFENPVRCKDGSERWIVWNAQKLADYKGAPAFLAVGQDVTEQKQATQLRQAMESAGAINRARRDFVASVSHDLRNPLNVIAGYIDILLAGDLTQDKRELLKRVDNATKQLLSLTNDLLDFSKIDAGKLDLQPRDFDVSTLLSSSFEGFVEAARRRGLRLFSQIAGDTPKRLVGDPDRLRQILVNLLGNALKFTPTGHIRVSTSSHDGDGNRVVVRFEVTDTGIGIAPEACPKLFQPFVQVGTSRVEGAGLGLAICKKLVEHMNGQIGVESTLGRGSTFWFAVPLSKP